MISFLNDHAKGSRRSALEWLASWIVNHLADDARAKRTMLSRLFSRHLSQGCRALVEFDNHCFIVDPKDTVALFALMNGEPWQRDELLQALTILLEAGRLREDGVFLDVGANIGTQTIYALPLPVAGNAS